MALIFPTVALPPAIPFTDHVTVWSVVPFTFAESCSVSPARTAAVLGVTTTDDINGFVFVPALIAPHAVQRHVASVTRRAEAICGREILAILDISLDPFRPRRAQSCGTAGRLVEVDHKSTGLRSISGGRHARHFETG